MVIDESHWTPYRLSQYSGQALTTTQGTLTVALEAGRGWYAKDTNGRRHASGLTVHEMCNWLSGIGARPIKSKAGMK